jgi:hypothetical protein
VPSSLVDTGAKLARIDLVKMPSGEGPKLPLDPTARKEALRGPKDPPSNSGVGAPSRPKPAPEEDWSSLGLADPAPSVKPPSSSSKKPYSRKHSVGIEMPLPTAGEADISEKPPALPAELEMSLPIHDGPRQLIPRPSMELEAVIPTAEKAPEPAAAPPPARRPLPSAELEMPLPTVAAAPVEPSSAVSTPRREAPEPVPPSPPAKADDGLDFELHAPASGRHGAAAPLDRGAPQVITAPVPGKLKLQVARPTLGERLVLPVALLLGGLVVGLADFAYHKITGNSLELGPVRPFWIAAPLALVGVGLLLWRLIGVHEDE